jgi:hypothetical protein
VNVAYKHLDSKLRIGELTLSQWFGLAFGVIVAVLYALYLSPFGPMLTMLTAVYIGGVPVSAIFITTFSEFDLLLLIRSAIAWYRRDARYLPGAGITAIGYQLTRPLEEIRLAERTAAAQLDLDTLWENAR